MHHRFHLRYFSLIVVALLVSLHGVHAQDSGTPPAVISLTADVISIALPDAEAGTTPATLRWAVTELRDSDRVLLQWLVGTQWTTLNAQDEILPPVGELTINITHPQTFAPPTYRVVIVDGSGQEIDQQIVMIPYAAADTLPDIVSFSSTSAGVDAVDIENARAEIPITWQVVNRAPGTNLRFDQALPDGRLLPVETARAHQWIASTGQGSVLAASAEDPRGVVLRLSVVNLLDSSILDSAEIVVPMTAAQPTREADTTQQLEPVAPPQSDQPPAISDMTASLEDASYGDAVMVSWQVENPASITLTATPGDRAGTNIGVGLQNAGNMSYTLPDGDYYRVELALTAENSAGRDARSLIVYMKCRTPYFFGAHHDASLCPEAPAARIQAAYQTFEGGNMIWRSDTDAIYVFYGNGQFAVFPDTYQEGETINITGTPPDERLAPVRGFGKVWADNPLVQNALGWATQRELGYTMTVQNEAPGTRISRTYLTLFDGQLIYQSTAGTGVTAGGTWGYVQN